MKGHEVTETGNSPMPPAALSADIAMMQMLAGFQVSQALYVVAKLNIPTILDYKGRRTITELAAEADANPDALGRVIRFLASVGVFRTDGEQVEITELGATLAERPGSRRPGALYWMETHYAPFAGLLETVRTGENASVRYYGEPFFDWITKDPDRVELQNQAFASFTDGVRKAMFDGYVLPGGQVVADIGGADGTMLARLLASDLGRQGIVFDLPNVSAPAADVVANHALSDRVQVIGGDFFESVPVADVYVLSAVLHDWSDEDARRILANIAKVAKPGARLVVIESVMPAGDEPHPIKVIDLVMLALAGGRERTEQQYRALLDSAGFTLDRIVPSPTPFSFIEAILR